MKEKVKAWMKENGVDESELAKRLGVSDGWVTDVLFGGHRVSANRLDHLSQITGMSVEALLGVSTNSYAGYEVMVRGGVERLTDEQESEILDVAMLANDYDWVRHFVQNENQTSPESLRESFKLICVCGKEHEWVMTETDASQWSVRCTCGKTLTLMQTTDTSKEVEGK